YDSPVTVRLPASGSNLISGVEVVRAILSSIMKTSHHCRETEEAVSLVHGVKRVLERLGAAARNLDETHTGPAIAVPGLRAQAGLEKRAQPRGVQGPDRVEPGSKLPGVPRLHDVAR